MGHPSSRHLFGHFTYEKTTDEIGSAMQKKVESLKAKIVEREGRIAKIRAEYEISDQDMIQLLTQEAQHNIQNNVRGAKMSYTLTTASPGAEVGANDERIIGAGVVQNLLTERSLIEDEQASVKQMERIVRNLKPLQKITENGTTYELNQFELSDAELEFLGF